MSMKKKSRAAIEYWLNVLKSAIESPDISAQRDGTFSLFYILKPSVLSPLGVSTLHLELKLARHLKAGGLGKPASFSLTSSQHEKHLSSEDKEFLFKLKVLRESLSRAGMYFSSTKGMDLKGERSEALVYELLATGRCHWESLEHPALTKGETKQLSFVWEIQQDGYQKLQPDLGGSSLSLVLINQVWYIDKKTQKIGIVDLGVDRKMLNALLCAPKIPAENVSEIQRFFSKNHKLSSLATPKLLKTQFLKKQSPVPCLLLSKEKVQIISEYPSAWRYPPRTAEEPIAKLWFDYQGAIVSSSSAESVIHIVSDGKLLQIERDRKKEKEALDEMASFGLFPNPVADSFKHHEKNEDIFIISTPCDPFAFSLHLPKLRAKGWKIEISPDYPYQVIEDPIDDWYSSIREESNYDWFNLELGIQVKGEKINLLPLLQKMAERFKGNPEELARQTFMVRLSSGQYAPLPPERVWTIFNTLIELYDKAGLSEDKTLRLSKFHAARLMEIEAALGSAHLRWFGGDRLRKLGEKLTHFKGIQAVDMPIGFQGDLRPYQAEGLNWLQFLREYELGGILADDMGLGKTIQALAHILTEKKSGRMAEPTLVVAPTSLMFNWRLEAEKFAPELKVLVLHGAQRKRIFEKIPESDLVLTTYPLLIRDKATLIKQPFHLLLLDEAQYIKNSKSLATQIVQQIQAKHRVCLTGTPLENHLGELWSLVNFLMPGFLGDEKKFNQVFRNPIEKQADQDRRMHLNRRMAPFLLRRTKDKVAQELPEKIETIHHVELEGAQRDLYETIRTTMQDKIRQEIEKMGLSRSHIVILEALLKLRQVCCDPRLLKMESIQKDKANSSKLDFLMNLLPELLEEGRRILLFSQFTEMLSLIEEELVQRKITYVKLTGKTKDRETPVSSFQSGQVPLFLISLKAGGTGLNLTAADTIIHYDPWWNPAVESQATGRAHRIGQNKTVFVYKLVTQGTVEEKILQMQENKRLLMEGLFSENATQAVKLTEDDLKELFEPLER